MTADKITQVPEVERPNAESISADAPSILTAYGNPNMQVINITTPIRQNEANEINLAKTLDQEGVVLMSFVGLVQRHCYDWC